MYSLVTCTNRRSLVNWRYLFWHDKDLDLNEPSDLIIMTKDIDLYFFWQDVSWDPVGTLHEYWLPVYLEEERETLQQKIQIFQLRCSKTFQGPMFWCFDCLLHIHVNCQRLLNKFHSPRNVERKPNKEFDKFHLKATFLVTVSPSGFIVTVRS